MGVTTGFYTTAFRYIPKLLVNDTSGSSPAASGGGASAFFAKPAWQTGPGVPTNGARNVPDLAFNASPIHDPYLVISGGTLYAYGGTSVGAPVMAGVLALANEVVARNEGSPGTRNINPSLYGMAQKTGPEALSLRDITTGSNKVPCVPGTPDCVDGLLGFAAGAGYDQVTGLGSLYVEGFVLGYRIATNVTVAVAQPQAMLAGSLAWTAKVDAADPRGAAKRRPLTGVVRFIDSEGTVDPTGLARGVANISEGRSQGPASFTATYSGDSLFAGSVFDACPAHARAPTAGVADRVLAAGSGGGRAHKSGVRILRV